MNGLTGLALIDYLIAQILEALGNLGDADKLVAQQRLAILRVLEEADTLAADAIINVTAEKVPSGRLR